MGRSHEKHGATVRGTASGAPPNCQSTIHYDYEGGRLVQEMMVGAGVPDECVDDIFHAPELASVCVVVILCA